MKQQAKQLVRVFNRGADIDLIALHSGSKSTLPDAVLYHFFLDVFLDVMEANDKLEISAVVDRAHDLLLGVSPGMRDYSEAVLNVATNEKVKAASLQTKVFCPTGAGGGVDATCKAGAKGAYVPPTTNEARGWVGDQKDWKGKVTTKYHELDIADIKSDAAVSINKRTVKKHKKAIEKNGLTRPFVVSKMENGKYHLQDGNHYQKAIGELFKEGKIKRETLKKVGVVEVVPKKGYKFEFQMVGGLLPMQRLVSDKKKAASLQTKVFCPTGAGGGVDATCKAGAKGAYVPPTTNEAGQLVPGTVGKFAGISTGSWKISQASAQVHLKKIATLEKLASEGKWGQFQKKMSKANPATASSAKLKAQLQAQENLLAQKGEKLQKLAPGATATDNNPAVADGKNWKKIGPSLGTEIGGTYEMGGKKYYVKIPDDPNRAHNEVLTSKLYKAAGAGIADHHLVEIDGKVGVATEWLEGSTKPKWDMQSVKDKAADDFGVHAWLNNRDAVGAGSENPMDNIKQLPNGELVAIDVGGGLDYKGMGGGGKKPMGEFANEFSSMRDAKQNPSMHKVFGKMTDEQLMESAEKVTNITEQTVKDIVNKYHPGNAAAKQDMVKKLIARKDDLEEKGLFMQEKIADKHDGKKVAAVQKVAAVKKKITIDTDQFPPPPTLLSTNETHIAANKNDVKSIISDGAAGDIATLQWRVDNGFYKSPKVKNFAEEVISNVMQQQNPPPAPTPLSGAFHEISAKVESAAGKAGLEKIGYWDVLADMGGIPEGIPQGFSFGASENATHAKGEAEFNKLPQTKQNAIRSYTGGGYRITNPQLRGGWDKAAARAKNVANGVMTAARKLPEGKKVTRFHSLAPLAIQSLTPGKIVSDKGVLSTSTKPEGVFTANNVKWNITIGPDVKGLAVSNVSSHSSEKEILFPPNQRIMVKSVQRVGAKHYVDAIMLPTLDNQCCPN